jgi:two-component system, chemotaxis family, CheB/CheR fusion protein
VTTDSTAEARSAPREDDLEPLLEHIMQSRGFDFSGYKRNSLRRRIDKRLEELGVESYSDYKDYLEVHPDEFTTLFDTILINVTGFFRDEAAWRYLAQQILPSLVAGVSKDRPIRVWSAACSSGEEAYTVAMLLAEELGQDGFLERVKIYATDVDEDALNRARLAVYPLDSAKSIPPELLEKYWQVNGNKIAFRSDLRRCVIFGRNDLMQDAPISRVDLLVSRNALMYFIPEAQARILSHFNFSLNPNGFLFLGKSEMLLTYGALFKPYNLKWRVFTKVPRGAIRERLAFLTGGPGELDVDLERSSQLRDGAADTAPVAQIVVGPEGQLAVANASARRLFGIKGSDIGRPLQELEISFRPVELRDPISRALQDRKPIDLGRTELQKDGTASTFEVQVGPLNGAGEPLGVSVTYTDVTELVELAERFEESRRELASAYEELQSTVEELETTNEELQSTNEELETTNEELQSTNEELETMNEELQSTNDELEAMNDQQRERSDEVDRLNLFLEGILGNLGVGVVVLDADQLVQVWNSSAGELWGLRAEEVVGKHFLGLDIGLPVERVRGEIRSTLEDGASGSSVSVQAINRRGKQFECEVRVLPLRDRTNSTYGVILLMAGKDGGVSAEAPHATQANE